MDGGRRHELRRLRCELRVVRRGVEELCRESGDRVGGG